MASVQKATPGIVKPEATSSTVIWLHADAPRKPALGQACNGCGVCCAAEPCPVARVFLWQLRGSCQALEWHAEVQQYRCGLLMRPAYYLPWLRLRWQNGFARRTCRWVAARTAWCPDSEAEPGSKA